MNRIIFFDKNLAMRFLADILKRGDIRTYIINGPDGSIEIRTWDAPK